MTSLPLPLPKKEMGDFAKQVIGNVYNRRKMI